MYFLNEQQNATEFREGELIQNKDPVGYAVVQGAYWCEERAERQTDELTSLLPHFLLSILGLGWRGEL